MVPSLSSSNRCRFSFFPPEGCRSISPDHDDLQTTAKGNDAPSSSTTNPNLPWASWGQDVRGNKECNKECDGANSGVGTASTTIDLPAGAATTCGSTVSAGERSPLVPSSSRASGGAACERLMPPRSSSWDADNPATSLIRNTTVRRISLDSLVVVDEPRQGGSAPVTPRGMSARFRKNPIASPAKRAR